MSPSDPKRNALAIHARPKNTLGYMERKEFEDKIELSRFLGLTPLFAVRMMPKTWINDLNEAGGFALILKYQLYPWTHKELARRVAQESGCLSMPRGRCWMGR